MHNHKPEKKSSNFTQTQRGSRKEKGKQKVKQLSKKDRVPFKRASKAMDVPVPKKFKDEQGHVNMDQVIDHLDTVYGDVATTTAATLDSQLGYEMYHEQSSAELDAIVDRAEAYIQDIPPPPPPAENDVPAGPPILPPVLPPGGPPIPPIMPPVVPPPGVPPPPRPPLLVRRALRSAIPWVTEPTYRRLEMRQILVNKMKPHAMLYRNPHEESAAMRTLATIAGIVRLADEVRDMDDNILNMWGSREEYHLLNQAGFQNVYLHRPVVVAQDIGRAIPDGARMFEPTHPYDILFMRDTYATTAGPLTPGIISDFLTLYHARAAIWIGQRFVGTSGETAEGAWVRQGEFIHAKQDVASSGHPLHSACDWIHKAGCLDGVSWTQVSAVGFFDVVIFKPLVTLPYFSDVAEGLKNSVVVQSASALYYLLPRLPNWWGLCDKLLIEYGTTVRLDTSFYEAMVEYLSRSRATPFAYVSLHRAACEWYNTNRPTVQKMFPEYVQKDIEVTIWRAWYDSITTRCYLAATLRTASGEAGGQLRDHSENITSPFIPGISFKTIFALAGVGAAILYAYSLYKRIAAYLPQLLPASWLTNICKSFRSNLNSTVYIAVIAPCIEEYLKHYHPIIGSALIGAETASNIVTYGMGSALTGLACHVTTWGLPLPVAIATHSIYNIISLAAAVPIVTPWENWVKRIYVDQDLSIAESVQESSHTTFPPCKSYFPRYTVSNTVKRALDPTLEQAFTISNPEYKDDATLRGGPCFAIWPTNIFTGACSTNATNLHTMYVTRLLNAPVSDSQPHFATYLNKYVDMLKQESVVDITPSLLSAWLLSFPPGRKRNRIKNGITNFLIDPLHYDSAAYRSIKVWAKADEFLVRSLGQVPDFRPRPIAGPEPVCLCAYAPALDILANVLKEKYFNAHFLFSLGRFNMTVKWACGVSEKELGIWYTDALATRDCYSLIVLGDDSLLIDTTHRDPIFWVSDFSAYDQSQRLPLLQIEWSFLVKLGLHPDSLKAIQTLSHATYTSEDKTTGMTLRLRRDHQTFRDTGGGDTAIGNSIITSLSYMFAFDILDVSEERVKERFTQLALKIKLRVTTDAAQVDFLKGIWLPTTRTKPNDPPFVWTILPSRFLKFGVMRDDPRVLYKEESFEKACLYHLTNVAKSYAPYTKVPLLRALIQRFAGLKAPALPSWWIGEHAVLTQITGDEMTVTAEDAIAAYTRRYDFDMRYLLQLEQLIAQQPLFTFFQHPVFGVMARRDYE